MNDLDAALTVFIQEAEELLIQMEQGLLLLEETPSDKESINNVFRAMHTIKGSAGLFGLEHVVAFCHCVETVMDAIRKDQRAIDKQIISVLLSCKDFCSELIEYNLSNQSPTLPERLAETSNQLIQQLHADHALISKAPLDKEPEITAIKSVLPEDNWLIILKFHTNALRNGIDPIAFISFLKGKGSIVTIQTLTSELPIDFSFDSESCYLQFHIVFHTQLAKQDIAKIFEFAEDDCDIRLLPPDSKIEQYLKLLQASEYDADGVKEIEKLGEILTNIGALTASEINQALQQQEQNQAKRLGEILVEQQFTEQVVVTQALQKQESEREKASKAANYIRVDATKLGRLINLVGELVISGASINLLAQRYRLTELDEAAAHMSGLVSEIRDSALQLRMVSIGETFSRFKRVVRDVSSELNKQIELVVTGGETELDKALVEKINDPLTHLIRNALDHGIELPEQRLASGKPAQGNIYLNAYHDSGHIVIEVADDGAGLNADKILAKAIKNGLVTENQQLSQQEIFNLIFAAGLSTKDQANNLSGRGVGMDVVRKNILALRGAVNVTSQQGVGTTITIRLPLTLAIIDGFMVVAENERYIIPLNMIEECVEMNASEWKIDTIKHYINLRGDVLPYLRLADYFQNRTQHIPTDHRESLVVVKMANKKIGLVVDELQGEHQTVIKPLGKIFERLQGVSGATILGNGDVALILDVQGLIQHAMHDTNTSYQSSMIANSY